MSMSGINVKLSGWVDVTWWGGILIRMYQLWMWIRPKEPTMHDCEIFVEWLFQIGALKAKFDSELEVSDGKPSDSS